MKKFLYFQPEYVEKFQCDGSKCDARCCKDWTITIDAATYKKYSRIKPKEKAKEILSHFKFDSERGAYVVQLWREIFSWQKNSSASNPNTLTASNATGAPGGGILNCCEREWDIPIDNAVYKKYRNIKPSEKSKEILVHIEFDDTKNSHMLKGRPCPFLTAEKLCRIQLEYGESFLSQTCVTYPRITYNFGKFFERSLTLTCPVAAEMVLFAQEPLKFEFVEVPEKIHGKHGRIKIQKLPTNENSAELIREAQVTMIFILQERKFSVDQRLIVLGLFLDRLQDLISGDESPEILFDLIAAYRSEEFLLEQMPPLLQGFNFDANQFVTFMIKFIDHNIEILNTKEGRKFIAALEKILGITPDENNQVSLSELAANFEKLADDRKIFSEKYSAFLENYLVNELFSSVWPWRFRDHSLTKNFAVFLISFKIFELVTFATVQSGLDSKEDLLTMVDWFMTKSNHNPKLYKRFLELLEGVDDTYLLMATLL